MGPERILPNPEEDALQDRPSGHRGAGGVERRGHGGGRRRRRRGQCWILLSASESRPRRDERLTHRASGRGNHRRAAAGRPGQNRGTGRLLSFWLVNVDQCWLVYSPITLLNEPLVIIMTIFAVHGYVPAPSSS